MIEIRNVSKRYAKGNLAVNNISFDVPSGEIFGFLGPNGAGKTTTIKMIVGLLEQNQGHILVNGIDTLEEPLKVKEQIAYVPDNPVLYERLRGTEYLAFVADMFRMAPEVRDAKINEYATMFNLRNDLQDMIGTYSHGMQQKLALIAALIHEPDVFILDEPMVGLDPKSSFSLKEHMRARCEEGKTVFFSTHVLDVAERICDRIAIINKGKIIAIGTMDELRENHEGTLEKMFLELTQ
ncbi:MAG: ABC transporter ATP-binding protein [Tissierellia bacterium]|jgi:ABC-2 type transport system ATP-binding protein|nr:ABC transporter ATP-binding protein [Bacillota bacterium]NLK59134.1 ABC transporter ATP-binding protein [Tissierellia bacterium]